MHWKKTLLMEIRMVDSFDNYREQKIKSSFMTYVTNEISKNKYHYWELKHQH